MSSVYDIAGNNVPVLSATATSKQTLEYVRLLVDRKRNSFAGYSGDEGIGADAYNRAVLEIEEEIDLNILKLETYANT